MIHPRNRFCAATAFSVSPALRSRGSEMAALSERHIRMYTPAYWDGHQPREARSLAPVMRLLRDWNETVDDPARWMKPFETGVATGAAAWETRRLEAIIRNLAAFAAGEGDRARGPAAGMACTPRRTGRARRSPGARRLQGLPAVDRLPRLDASWPGSPWPRPGLRAQTRRAGSRCRRLRCQARRGGRVRRSADRGDRGARVPSVRRPRRRDRSGPDRPATGRFHDRPGRSRSSAGSTWGGGRIVNVSSTAAHSGGVMFADNRRRWRRRWSFSAPTSRTTCRVSGSGCVEGIT